MTALCNYAIWGAAWKHIIYAAIGKKLIGSSFRRTQIEHRTFALEVDFRNQHEIFSILDLL